LRAGAVLAALTLALAGTPALAQTTGKADAASTPASLVPAPLTLTRPPIVSPGPEQSALTVYQSDDFEVESYYGDSGLALVTEWRTVELPAGESVIQFRGVAESMVPQTAALDGLPARIVERNQDYDLLSPGSLIAKSLGQPVTRVRTNRKTGIETRDAGIIRSGPEGVILEIDGRYEALNCSGDPERLVFDQVPAGLADKPTLSMRVRAETPGRYRVRLTYLAVGLDWKANYVAALNPGGQSLTLTGWITLSNATGTSFPVSPTQVVAGDTEREPGEDVAVVPEVMGKEANCWPIPGPVGFDKGFFGALSAPPPPPPPAPMAMMADAMGASEIVVTGSRVAEQTELGDYKLYTLPSPTSVAARQTKQVLMLAQPAVTFDLIYEYRLSVPDFEPGDTLSDFGEPEAETAGVILRADNKKDRGLGLPLPKGDVVVTEPAPGGGALVIGETDIGNIAIGGPLKIDLVETSPVIVRNRVTRVARRGKTGTLFSIEARVTNGASQSARFEYLLEDGGPVRIVRSSVKPMVKAGGRFFPLLLAPGEEQTLTYTIIVER
jgi:hypothetical protein